MNLTSSEKFIAKLCFDVEAANLFCEKEPCPISPDSPMEYHHISQGTLSTPVFCYLVNATNAPIDACDWLFKRGFSPYEKDSNGLNAIERAWQKGCHNFSFIEFAIRKDLDVSTLDFNVLETQQLISTSILLKDNKLFDFCIQKLKSIKERGEFLNINPFNAFKNNPNLEKMKELVEEGFDINAVDAGHFSPVILAVQYAKLNFLKTLVELGADLDISVFGFSPKVYLLSEIAGYPQGEKNSERKKMVDFLEILELKKNLKENLVFSSKPKRSKKI